MSDWLLDIEHKRERYANPCDADHSLRSLLDCPACAAKAQLRKVVEGFLSLYAGYTPFPMRIMFEMGYYTEWQSLLQEAGLTEDDLEDESDIACAEKAQYEYRTGTFLTFHEVTGSQHG